MFLNSISVFADSSVTAELSIGRLGHIFTDKAIKIDAMIINSGTGQNVEYSLNVTYEDGNVVYTTGESLAMKAGGFKIVNASFTAPKYGFYNVDVIVNGVVADSTRFSVVHAGKEPNKKIGINSHYQAGRGTAEVDTLQKLFADTGFGQMREGIPWNQYEPAIGSYGLTANHTKFLNAFKNNGQNHLLIIGHENLARGITFPRTEEQLTAWCAYVEKLMQDVAPYGIKDFELWNEVNITEAFGLGAVTAEQYAALIKATKPILDKYVPDNRLFVFSLAGEQYTGAWSEFMDECLAIDGCIENFDGISYHPYFNGDMPEEKFSEALAEIETTVEKWGLEDKARIISEAGYTYSDETAKEMERQAKYNVRLAAMAYGAVEYIDWFMNIEKIDQADAAQVHFGWLRGWKDQEINYEAKPAFAAMANFNALLANAETNGNASLPDKDRYLYKFKKDGKDVYMIWKTEGTEKIKLAVGADSAEVYDFYGNPIQKQISNGALRLTIGDAPIYIVGEFTDCAYIDTNIVTVRGNVEEENKSVTIMVFRPEGITDEKTGDLVYVGETRTDAEGDYSFSFKDPVYNKGVYTVKLRVGNELSTMSYEYDVAVPHITLTGSDGEEIEKIDDISETEINARLEVINILDYTVEGMIICGLYKNDALISAEMIPAYVDNTESVKNYTLKYAKDKDIDTVKVFMWNPENCSPLVESIVIE